MLVISFVLRWTVAFAGSVGIIAVIYHLGTDLSKHMREHLERCVSDFDLMYGDELAQLPGEVGLTGVRMGRPFHVQAAAGLVGFEIETDYHPFDDKREYHRVHAVLVDGDALVHVFYVAGTPDAASTTFQLVLNSLRNEEG